MQMAHRLVVALGLGSTLLSIWTGCTGVSSGESSRLDASGNESGTASGSSGSDGSGNTASSGASDGGASGCFVHDGGSLFGMTCPTQCAPCCEVAFSRECLNQGGAMERCNSVNCNNALSGTCYPPPPPEAGTVRCAATSCPVGQLCVHQLLGPMDGCERHECMVPPFQCADAATCACISAGADASSSGSGFGTFVNCTQDDAGNATASYSP